MSVLWIWIHPVVVPYIVAVLRFLSGLVSLVLHMDTNNVAREVKRKWLVAINMT